MSVLRIRALTGALALLASLATGTVLTGCGGNGGGNSPDKQQAGGPQIPEDMKHLSELPAAEQEAALAQKICPVSGKPLGSMAGVKKITVEGREVFICCAGCEEPLKADPEKYLAKLQEQE